MTRMSFAASLAAQVNRNWARALGVPYPARRRPPRVYVTRQLNAAALAEYKRKRESM